MWKGNMRITSIYVGEDEDIKPSMSLEDLIRIKSKMFKKNNDENELQISVTVDEDGNKHHFDDDVLTCKMEL